jgi:hypothetical protein
MAKNISYREPAGSAIFGHTDIVDETTRIHIRGYANTSGNMIYAEDSLGVERFKVLDNGEVYSNGNLLGAGTILTVERTISSSEILNLFSSPITLIPAPGVGKVIVPISILTKLFFGGTAYSNTQLNYTMAGNNMSVLFSFINNAASRLNLSNVSFNTSTGVENSPFLLIGVANPTLGNGTMKVIVYYAIANV